MRKTALLLGYAALQIDCGPYFLADILYINKRAYLLQQSLAVSVSLLQVRGWQSKGSTDQDECCIFWKRAYRVFAYPSWSPSHLLHPRTVSFPFFF